MNTMKAKDAVSASLAECFVTIDGNRYNFMQAIDLEATFEKQKTEVPILGKTGRVIKALVGEEQELQPSTITPVFSGNCFTGIRTLVKIFTLIFR